MTLIMDHGALKSEELQSLDGTIVELPNGYIGMASKFVDGYHVLVINRSFGPFKREELKYIGQISELYWEEIE